MIDHIGLVGDEFVDDEDKESMVVALGWSMQTTGNFVLYPMLMCLYTGQNNIKFYYKILGTSATP